MRWHFILYILFSGCLFKEEMPQDDDVAMAGLHVAMATPFSAFADEGLIIESEFGNHSIEDIKQMILLVPQPRKEELTQSEWQNALSISLKNSDQKFRYVLKAKKDLPAGFFGIYFRDKKSTSAKLGFVFWVKKGEPLLSGHDLGLGPDLKVPENRRHFSLNFDQPIYVPDDVAIKVYADEKPLELSEIVLANDGRLIKLTLKESGAFIGAKTGVISFAGLRSSYDDKPVFIAPIEFSITDKSPALSKNMLPSILLSHDSAEIKWHLDRQHRAELYFAEDINNFDCLGQACPHEAGSTLLKDSFNGFNSSFFLSQLKSDTKYYFVLRAEDMQAHVVIARGSFKTFSQAKLRFSEILINPKPAKGFMENSAEFIELFNARDDAIEIFDLKLIFSDLDGLNERHCQITNNKKPLSIKAKSYVLLVAKEYDEQKAKLSEDVLLLKQPKKKLCGGLANDRAQLIRIVGEGEQLFDRFGGHFWPAPDGLSIERKNVLGPDDASNYALSPSKAGPSPGRGLGT